MNLRKMAEQKVSIAFEDDNDRKEFMDWYWKNGGCKENNRDVYLPSECQGVNLWIYDDNGYMPEEVYQLMLSDFYSVDFRYNENGIKLPILEEMNNVPSLRQFLYWFEE